MNTRPICSSTAARLARTDDLLVTGQRSVRRLLAVALAVTVLWPSSAMADTGTPLLWGTVFHLFLGNALLGWAEGWLLARVFDLRIRRCVGWLIPANYLSAWAGMFLAAYLFESAPVDIYALGRIVWSLIGATYVLTLLIEWPFVAACFRGTGRWFQNSIRGSLLIQSASYVLLFGGYWLLTGSWSHLAIRKVPPGELTPPSGIVVFYISRSDGSVYASRLGGADEVKVAEAGSADWREDHLELLPALGDTNYWDLAVVGRGRHTNIVWPRISTQSQVTPDQAWRTRLYGGWGWTVFRVAKATNSQWQLGWAQWPEGGVWARADSRTVHVAVGFPFGGWSVYRAIHLPHDYALLQLEDQICLLDIPGRRLASLRSGYGVLALHQTQIATLDKLAQLHVESRSSGGPPAH